jgi:transposase InsO family protein
MNHEIALRTKAIRQSLDGDSQASIARSLGKSRYWVGYWLVRYDPDDPVDSLHNRTSAPKHPHRKWSDDIIRQAVTSRRLRTAAQQPEYQYALVGAEAIHYELQRLQIEPTPPSRTIHYWLKQAGLVERSEPRNGADHPPKPYPLPTQKEINDLHQLDMKGPFYLTGSSQKHYLVALRDYVSKGVDLDALESREAQPITDFLVAAWQQRGLPKVLQMDNGLEFRGSNRYPRSFGKVVRVCLDVGVEPLFVPPSEPWRNGLIENFNGLTERLLLERERLADTKALQASVRRFEAAVNTTHRLPALDGKTPHEFIAGRTLRLLAADYDGHKRDLQLVKGKVSFIRLVRKSGRITLCADDKFDIDPALAWQYVLAQVDIATQQLHVYHEGHLVKTFGYTQKPPGA